ncbi:ribosomal protein S18-alanine N-acetyltransferase [Roseivivax sp. GX 12232]|uniref:ribosomal protein S18-alanine N-acetyltransferase n=1 Tax=Roseivivax sp. GX 12232 TaxID=2900547 RepID=UPI001E342055|nr:ribosomal protein S18-alanine N-acetyltransferase [Roseivivax sp. GX 12232]MCE0505760.1 ribosomal protein S18-alanine N-acetyltransferase [Roseivivax sp. GX 12232]
MTPERLAQIMAAAYRHQAPWRADQIAASCESPGALLVTPSDAAPGFLLARALAGEAEILALAVAPEAQRQGLAGALLKDFHARAEARGCTRAFLEVAAPNAPARAFYARGGYAEAGLRRGYYHLPDGSTADAVVMARDLAPGPDM